MSKNRYARLTGTACAVLAFAACDPGLVPGPVPNVEPPDEPIVRNPDLPTPYELELCSRRVPTPRC